MLGIDLPLRYAIISSLIRGRRTPIGYMVRRAACVVYAPLLQGSDISEYDTVLTELEGISIDNCA